MLGEVPASRLKLIERIVDAARARAGGHLPASSRDFLRNYYRGVAEGDLAARSPRYLAAAALTHLRFGTLRPRGRPLVQIFNPADPLDGFISEHTLVNVVANDMPFLVDSLGIVFSQAGIGVHLIVHPVFAVERNARGRLRGIRAASEGGTRWESWQLIEIDRQLDAAHVRELEKRLLATLADVRVVVADWRSMRERARALAAELGTAAGQAVRAQSRQARELLEWMADNHFTFLGYRYYRLRRGRTRDQLVPAKDSGLGILRQRTGQHAPHTTTLTGDLRRRARERERLIVTKANSVATVHRATYLDYVGIKTFDAAGEVSGEHRFLGLWTSSAYNRSPRDIPVLSHKVDAIVRRFGLAPGSHDAKAVLHALETYPRDELFQATIPELMHIVRGVVNLYERDQVRVFVRRDAYERFYSCLVYVPRDRYNTEVRARIEAILREKLGGTNVEAQVQLSQSTLARLHVVVRTDPARRHSFDLDGIERAVAAAATTWADGLRAELTKHMDEAAALATAKRYATAFPAAYTEDVEPSAALDDIADLEALQSDPSTLRLRLHRPANQKAERVHLAIVKVGEPVPISDIMPMMENFGLRVIAERPYEIAWPQGGSAWIQDFELEHRDVARIDLTRAGPLLRIAILAAWRGEIENDGFNRLLLAAELSAREIIVLRAYCRYLLQTGIPFSQAYMERVLVSNAAVARNLFRLFAEQLDPNAAAGGARRAERLAAAIRRGLELVTSLDEDRILRAYPERHPRNLAYQLLPAGCAGGPRAYLSVKLDPQRLPELPLPRPKFEVFVYSPRVEAYICAWPTSPAAAFAGRTGARISARKSSGS